MGRPSKLNDAVADLLVKAAGLGMSRKLQADYAGISVDSLYTYLREGRNAKRKNKYSKFADRMKQAEARGALECLTLIHDAARGPVVVVKCEKCDHENETRGKRSWQAAGWLMERKHDYRRGGSVSQEAQNEAEEEKLEDLTEAQILERALVDVRRANRKAARDGSHQALQSGQRLELQMWRDLLAIRGKTEEALTELTDDEFAAELRQTMEGWPDQYLEMAIRVFEERHDMRILHVGAGGSA